MDERASHKWCVVALTASGTRVASCHRQKHNARKALKAAKERGVKSPLRLVKTRIR